MTAQWKHRLTSFAAAVALAGLAGACTSGDSDEPGLASEPPSATEDETSSDTSSTTTTTTLPDEPPPETTPPAEPEPAEVDIAGFEPFPLPDYAAAVLDDEYASYLVEVDPGVHVHVLEVGTGTPVYLQHGAPTSGLLYRRIAEVLPRDEFRLIMPTMVGLGFSTQVPAEDHTLDNHARWMNEVLNQLGLTELIYVGHDWGGPVGMGALARSPEMLAGAVVLNTSFGAPTGPVELNPQLQAILTPLPPEAEQVLSVAVFDQLAGAQNDPESLRDEVLDLYRRPVVEATDPVGPLPIFRMAATGPEHPTAEVLREIDDYLVDLEAPIEIVWGVNDPIFGERLSQMMEIFPDAPVTRTEAGHFLQEEVDAPEQIAAAIQRVRDGLRG